MTLADIVWSDLCVSIDPTKAWYKETPDSYVAAPLPNETWDEVRSMFETLVSEWTLRGGEKARYGFGGGR